LVLATKSLTSSPRSSPKEELHYGYLASLAKAGGNRSLREPWDGSTTDTETYRHDNLVERCMNQLKAFAPRAGHRYDKREYLYLDTANVASIAIWLRDLPANHLRKALSSGAAIGGSDAACATLM
jgi:hypothetical protein